VKLGLAPEVWLFLDVTGLELFRSYNEPALRRRLEKTPFQQVDSENVPYGWEWFVHLTVRRKI
jgi:hypothetical protein